MPLYALDLDTSIDDDIRKNYNPNKIEDDLNLPSLPKILNDNQPKNIKPISKTTQTTSKLTPQVKAQVQQNNLRQIPNIKKPQTTQKTSYATISKGSKIRLAINNSISDSTRRGTKLSFVLRYPVTTTYFTIPAGTVFYGEILNSHRPQFSANGGLIVLNINKFVIDNQVYSINTTVTNANGKRIFFNNIKGKRKYIRSAFKSMKPGFRYMGKMAGISGDLIRSGSTAILSPFSLAIGVVTAAGNVIISPALALFYKGDHIYVKEGSNLEVKLVQDLFIYR